MTRALRAWAINWRGKTRSVTYSTDRENKVSKRYVCYMKKAQEMNSFSLFYSSNVFKHHVKFWKALLKGLQCITNLFHLVTEKVISRAVHVRKQTQYQCALRSLTKNYRPWKMVHSCMLSLNSNMFPPI